MRLTVASPGGGIRRVASDPPAGLAPLSCRVAPVASSPVQLTVTAPSLLSSGFIGVAIDPPFGPWHAQIQASLAEAAVADSANIAAARIATPSLCLRPNEGIAATLPPAKP